MHDYKGCLHIHSTYSDGDASVPELLDAARDAGLHFLVLTAHAHAKARDDGWEGWHDGVLLVVGSELHAGHHHCMALGLGDLDGAARPDTAGQLQAIKRRGGLAFVVHPQPVHKPLFSLWTPGWTDWHLDTFDGLEIWPYMHDWIRDLQPWNFLSHWLDPDRWVTGPEPEILAAWDTVGRRRRCVGIGSLDHHARRVPFRRRGPALFELLPSRYAFRTVRTHLLAPEPLPRGPEAVPRLLALLAAGRCYVSYDLEADATGFRFHAHRGGQAYHMGDELPAAEPVELRVTTPHHATIRLLRDGQPLATVSGYELADRVRDPGVYRVEATLDDRPWLYSNPIYLRPPS